MLREMEKSPTVAQHLVVEPNQLPTPRPAFGGLLRTILELTGPPLGFPNTCSMKLPQKSSGW